MPHTESFSLAAAAFACEVRYIQTHTTDLERHIQALFRKIFIFSGKRSLFPADFELSENKSGLKGLKPEAFFGIILLIVAEKNK